MPRTATLFLATALLCVALAQCAQAQQPLISIESSSVPMVESFDSLGTAAHGLMPTGWVLSLDPSFVLGHNETDYSAGTSGNGALTSNSQPGFYNLADGDKATSTDRSIGFLTDQLSPRAKHLIVGFQNITGSPVSELQVSYDIEKYRSGTRPNEIHFFYGFDGVIWNEVTDALQHYDADAAIAVVNPPTNIGKSIALSNLNIPDQGSLYLRWAYTATTANNCQVLAIDNFQFLAGPLQQPDLQWDGAPGASWDTATANWKNSSAAHVVWSDNMPNNANFIDGGANVATEVNLPSPRRVGRLTFDAGSRSYTLSGSSLELSGAGGIGILAKSNALIQSAVGVTASQTWDVSSTLSLSGSLTLDSNVTLTKKGSGTVLLGGPQTISADSQIKVTEGTLRLGANLGNAAKLTISGNSNSTDATAVLEFDQDLSDLSLSTSDAGHQALNLSSPATAGAFRSLRVHAADLTASKSSLYAAFQQARLTPGDGIFDSSLAAHPGSALGLAIQGDAILIRPTRIGDVNLDGIVTISDFIDLASNFGRTGVTWQEGDLNYDGSVTISDFIDLASNFATTYAGDTLPISPGDQLALNSFAAAHGIAIPEPESMALLLLAALATVRRRRLQFAK
jgi:hypothetical protein